MLPHLTGIGARLETVDDAPQAIEKQYLFAFSPQWEVQNYVRTQAVDEERARLPAIMEAWRRAQQHVVALQENERDAADAIEVRPVPPSGEGVLARIEADPLFRRTFSTHRTTFELVEVDKVVAAQRAVHLAYSRRLTDALGTAPTVNELIDLFVAPRLPDTIRHLEVRRDHHVFSSRSADLRFLGSFRKDLEPEDLAFAEAGGFPVAAVIAFVGFGASSANAFRFGNRYYLHNGFHRLHAARAAGIRFVPMVVKHVNSLLDLPEKISGMPMEYLLESERPMLMKDFFDEDLSISLRVRDRIRSVSVNVVVQQHDVPT